MDTNVPFYSTLLVVDELIKANKDFDLIMFPNRGHGFGSEPYMVRRRWDYFVQAPAGRGAAGRIRDASAVAAGDATDGATPLGDGSRHAAHRHVARDFLDLSERSESKVSPAKHRHVVRDFIPAKHRHVVRDFSPAKHRRVVRDFESRDPNCSFRDPIAEAAARCTANCLRFPPRDFLA